MSRVRSVPVVEGVGPVLKSLRRFAYGGFEWVEGHDGEVGQAVLDVCPDVFDRVRVGAWAGSGNTVSDVRSATRSRIVRETWVLRRSGIGAVAG
ncbi:hypothetical protein ADK75_06180 [Streptomyces virginiae]|uniref:Uncharacterized protein n=1 Tax=Streptomyces virginiae TaxID=1961 RepID=A0A0L8N2H5_STRVG|nr:hypothetical protein ADK75_06180 [Streptomyces virginiae]